MVWSIFKYENSYVTTTKEEINGIPCLRFKPKGYDGVLPTVINYHGWHSSKDFKRFESLTIASHGYQVIAPDALYHGDRNPIDHDDPQNAETYLWKIILQSVKESKGFIEELINKYEADPRRIGVIGHSMGSITAGAVFTNNPSLKCIVEIDGSFAWKESIEKKYLPIPSEDDKALVEHYDPMNNLDKIEERSILILHGIEDTSVPIDTQRLFFNRVLPLYIKNRENIDFIEETNVNHRVTTGMLESAIMWFKEHL